MSKLDENGMWESSRMMLPEHKLRILESNKDFLNPYQDRPTLDEQEWLYISELFTISSNFKEPIKVTFYDPYNPKTVTGVVERMDIPNNRVKISGEWYPLKDVMGAGE